ncbi:hypothetical protein AAG747_28585 [Rapidithrix thailandica]|uniref:Uncharacterized protein n=1 Tax=Rapidithrix thailandica TaxID=413964 RepID=A0AAW9S9S9_9BACT
MTTRLAVRIQGIQDFSNGFVNSVVSSHMMDFDRADLDNEMFENSQFTGDIVSVGKDMFERSCNNRNGFRKSS